MSDAVRDALTTRTDDRCGLKTPMGITVTVDGVLESAVLLG